MESKNTLLKQLTQFGLNPKDWTVKIKMRLFEDSDFHEAVLAHKEIPELQLTGKCKLAKTGLKPHLHWSQLQLAGF